MSNTVHGPRGTEFEVRVSEAKPKPSKADRIREQINGVNHTNSQRLAHIEAILDEDGPL